MTTLKTVQQTADLLNCKRSTIYAWAKAGIIPHYKIGQLIRFKQQEIEEWLRGFKQEASKPTKTIQKFSGTKSDPNTDDIIRKAIDEAKGINV
jgi:excisionase family DNA binding protein